MFQKLHRYQPDCLQNTNETLWVAYLGNFHGVGPANFTNIFKRGAPL